MQVLLDKGSSEALRVDIDESRARAELRRQVGRLERELSALFAESFGHLHLDAAVPAPASGPRLLDLGELERLRDELAARISELRAALRERALVEKDNQRLLKEMIAAPSDFRWLKVTRADVGEPGCGAWHSRPRLGPIGMLMGWWRVKVSSGCPLAGRLAAVEHEAQAQKPKR